MATTGGRNQDLVTVCAILNFDYKFDEQLAGLPLSSRYKVVDNVKRALDLKRKK